MASFKTEGVILARTNYGEADRIFTILTPDRGKLSAIAKGVRRAASKLSPHLEPLTIAELMFAKGKSLDVITSARLKASFDRLGKDYDRLRRGFLFSEMLNRLTSSQTSAANYQLLVNALNALNDNLEPVVVELWYKLRLLDQLGYRPNLEQSVSSREEIIAAQSYTFSHESGGLVEASASAHANPNIGEDHIKLWRLLLEYSPVKLATVGGVKQAAVDSLPIANDFYDYLFGKRFKSAEI